MSVVELAANFMDRMMDCHVSTANTVELASRMLEARENGEDFLVIVVRRNGSYSHRAYGIRDPHQRISIPPHPPLTGL